MICPSIAARVEQPDSFSRSWIDRSDITALITIAGDARIRQILEFGRAAMLTANHVVDLMRETGVVLVNQAVLAATSGAAGYIGSDLLANITRHAPGSAVLSP
jgi:hypothetical protein